MALRIAPNHTNTIASRFEYEIRLLYRGDALLPTDPDDPDHDERYRCRFELEKRSGDGDWSAVEEEEVEIPKEDADESYRVLVGDNHAVPGADSVRGRMLIGSGGDSNSKPDYYERKNWIRDVKPAVPFRVEVRVKVGEEHVDVAPGQLFVGWRVLDPEEELDTANSARDPARPRRFLRDFLKEFKRDSRNDASREDDNCSEQFGGARPRDEPHRASSVLFQTPFSPPGSALEQGADDDFARSAVLPDDEDSTKGLTDVFLYPPPVGGDNYRLVLTLRNESGRPLRFKDPEGNELEDYRTGVFTLWRKITIKLLVTFSGINRGIIVWDDVKNAYRAAFTEIVPPGDNLVVTYDEAVWKEVVRDYFRNDVGNPSEAVINNDTHYHFNDYMLPQFPAAELPASDVDGGNPTSAWAKGHGKALAKKFLHRAYEADDDLTNPRTADAAQNTCPGLFMILARPLHPCTGLLGSYLGDREFVILADPGSDATITFAHEMGHALFLRHSLVEFHRGTNTTLDYSNKYWLDHDQGDAVPCVMAYGNDYYGAPDGTTVRTTRPVQWHFCAVCLLKLRFWDTVRLQSNAVFQEMIHEEWKDILVKHVSDDDPLTIDDVPAGGLDVSRGGTGHADLAALAKEEVQNNYGGPHKKNLTSMQGGEWHAADSSLASFTTHGTRGRYKGRVRPAGSGNGSTEVWFKIGDVVSNRVRINIRD